MMLDLVITLNNISKTLANASYYVITGAVEWAGSPG